MIQRLNKLTLWATTLLAIAWIPQQARSLSVKPDRPRLVVVGGGIGGLSSAYDARHILGDRVDVTVVSANPLFQFTPSNPWVAIGKRKAKDISIDLAQVLPRHKVHFQHGLATKLDPKKQRLFLKDGETIDYDYLIIATGPRLDFDAVPGLKEHGVSVCTTPHAERAAQALDRVVENPGPIVVGATAGASCFGPAYEYVLLVRDELKRRGGKELVEACPMTLVTSEPYVGHLGLEGGGESGKLMPRILDQYGIGYRSNTRLVRVAKDHVSVEHVTEAGKVDKKETIPSKLTMFIPRFRGHDVWKHVPGLTDTNGLIQVNDFQQSVTYPNIFGVGVCSTLPFAADKCPIPIGVPKTGYMIESMGTAAVQNIGAMLGNADCELHVKPTLNALCIADFGDTGAMMLAGPVQKPRQMDWMADGKVATLAKLAFEQYFLHKIESGDTDPYYEKYMLHLIGMDRVKKE